MDAKLKADWVAALRSGEYKQARQTLSDGKGHCCLGVLCEVAGATYDDYTSEEGTLYENVPVLDGQMISDGTDGELAQFWMKEIGLTAMQAGTLIEMNDDERAPFPMIADYIEANL